MSFICVICRDLLKIADDDAAEHSDAVSSSSSTEDAAASNSPLRLLQNNSSSSPSKLLNGYNNRSRKNNSIVATKCGHLFHYPCLSVWLSQSMNLTSDSKMRCPSCKQLIYIYELIQLFPVENGCIQNSDLEHWFSSGFQQTLREMLEQLERLCKDFQKKNGVEKTSTSPVIETPNRLRGIRDSPKKSNHQLAQLMKEMEVLRGSIKELNQTMAQQRAEMGSRLERQTKQICELRSKNEELQSANRRLQSESIENPEKKKEEMLQEEALVVLTSSSSQSSIPCRNNDHDHLPNSTQAITKLSAVETPNFSQNQQFSGKAQEPGALSTADSPSSNKMPARRKSVTFTMDMDPFDNPDTNKSSELISETSHKAVSISKDFRVGDKIIWHFEGKPELGTVKWKGFIGSQINVGVEFERQLGLPIKDLSNDALQCIFKCKPGHGRLIPVREVVLFNKAMFQSPNSKLKSSCTHQ